NPDRMTPVSVPERRIPMRVLLLLALGLSGIALFLIPAARAPIIRSGDTETDLRWAREGVGLWKRQTAEEVRQVHSLKPGYIFFLRLASGVIPGNPERSIVLVQSFLLWAGIAVSCLRLGRESRAGAAAAAYGFLVLFPPLR